MPVVELPVYFARLKKLFASRSSDSLKAFAAESATASLEYSDKRLAQFSIVAYALAKLIEKPYIVQSKRWKRFSVFLVKELEEGEQCKQDALLCEGALNAITADIEDLSSDLGQFVMNVVEKAKIKTATQVYSHGASIGRAIELTGADRKELLSYIGGTRLPEHFESKSVGQRLALADKLFK